MVEFAFQQKNLESNEFDKKRDKMIIVFDGDIFEEKVSGYKELIDQIEDQQDIAAVTNPSFELFLLLNIEESYEKYVQGNEAKFLETVDNNGSKYAYRILHDITGMNSKKNSNIGNLAKCVTTAIQQEKLIN